MTETCQPKGCVTEHDFGKNTDKKYVDVTKVSLEEWLALLDSPQKDDLLFIDYMFPTDTMRDEYIATIHNRSDDEVIKLLRRFLISSGSLGKDKFMLDFLMHCMKHDKEHFNILNRIHFLELLYTLSVCITLYEKRRSISMG